MLLQVQMLRTNAAAVGLLEEIDAELAQVQRHSSIPSYSDPVD